VGLVADHVRAHTRAAATGRPDARDAGPEAPSRVDRRIGSGGAAGGSASSAGGLGRRAGARIVTTSARRFCAPPDCPSNRITVFHEVILAGRPRPMARATG